MVDVRACAMWHPRAFLIVYLLLVYGAKTHKAHNSDPVYLLTRNPFTPLLRCE
jgi:hypothetical protein